MTRKVAWASAIGLFIILLFACGNDSFLLPLSKEATDLEIRSLTDGQILFPGDGVPVEIAAANNQKAKDLELEAVVYSPAGEKVWSSERLSVPTLNEPLTPLQLPDLATGQYKLELTLFSSGDEVQKKTVTFFNSKARLRIAGIKSFPAVITTASPVLLRAELDAPADSDPYLRWSWKGKAIANGTAGKGYGEVLWTAPAEEGVYTITLEVFPAAPAAQDKPLSSSLTMSTDIYVSAVKKAAPTELGPESSYFALYHFQANLKDSATTGAGADATLIGTPHIVPTEDGFGYSLSAGDGILIPRLVLPAESGTPKPFTVNMVMRLESAPPPQSRLLSIRSGDGGFAFDISISGDSLSPELTLSTKGSQDFRVPSNAHMQKDQRHLLSISLIPREGGSFTVQWFLDGEQTNSVESPSPLATLSPGKTVIGGENGFAGIIDEFGVFYRDENGAPSTDPGLFNRAALEKYKDALVLAEGFDGLSLPSGFTMSGTGSLDLGLVSLPKEAALKLPPIPLGDEGVDTRFELTPGSSQAAVLSLSWEGQEAPFLSAAIAAKAGVLQFSLTGEKVTFAGPDGLKTAKAGAHAKDAKLAVLISAPADARSAVIVDSVLIIQKKE